jgi:hypothetical protein
MGRSRRTALPPLIGYLGRGLFKREKRPAGIADMEKHTAEAKGRSGKEENSPTNFRKMAHFREDQAEVNRLAVLQLQSTESNAIEWLFPQEKATLHRTGQRTWIGEPL